MKIRISIRWMLIGVAYVAVAVVACARPADGWKHLLWLVNVLTMLYAILAVVYFRRQRQALAAGFLLFAAAHIVVLWWSPASTPGQYLAHTIAFDGSFTSEKGAELQARIETLYWEQMVSNNAASDAYRERVEEQFSSAMKKMSAYWSNRTLHGTIDAVVTMLAGLIGCLAGAHVWTIAQKKEQT